MYADDSKDVVMKGVIHGACDYLIKPIRIEVLKTIWQHVVRKKKNEWKDIEQSGSWDEGDRDRHQKQNEVMVSSPPIGGWKNPAILKNPRVKWTQELHQRMVDAIYQLGGINKAVPKKILELMNVPGLIRENVASHLQKHRSYLRRISGLSQHQGGLNSKVRYGGEQHQLTNVNKQVNLLHGIPNTMEPKQLGGINQPAQSHPCSSLVMQMIPQQARGQILNENLRGQVPGIQSTARLSMQPNNTASGVLLRNGTAYNPISQTGPMLDFSANQALNIPQGYR